MKVGKRFLSVLVALAMLLAVFSTGVTAFAATAIRFPDVYTSDLVQPDNNEQRVEEKVKALVDNMTTDEKWTFIHGSGMGTTEGDAGSLPGVPRFGVPEVRMHDGPGGLFYITPTTNPPQEEMLAATWDEEMANLYGTIYSTEAKAMGCGMMLSAQVDIQRMPQFARTKDQMGEDPYLLSSLSDDLVKGMQSEGGIAVLKHFVGYTDGMENDAISEQALHETYLPGFETAIKNANALGVMSSYNSINGTAAANNAELQNGVLRDQWGYKYFTITDWLMGNHGYSLDKGTDIEMPYGFFNNKVLSQVKSDGDTMKLVNQSVTRILRAYGRAGYLTLVKVGSDGKPLEEQGRTKKISSVTVDLAAPALEALSDRNSDIAQEVAESGAVLLKDKNNALPLSKKDKVGVVGYTGMNPVSGYGGERSYGTIAQNSSTYDELAKQLGAKNVSGTPYKDYKGVIIPTQYLYTDATGSTHGLNRTYGVNSLHSSMISAESMQGAGAAMDVIKPVTDVISKVPQTGMPGHEYGETAGIDPVMNFTTGLRNGKPNGTYKVSRADPGTASAFPYSSKPAYTWEGYIEAPEDGEYIIGYNSIGGLAEATIYDTDGTTPLAEINSTSGTRQGAQWQDGITQTATGMSIKTASVKLKKGQLYKIHAEAMYSDPQKDLQVSLTWVTPSQQAANQAAAAKIAQTSDKVVIFAYALPINGAGMVSTSAPKKEDYSMKLEKAQEDMINETAAVAHKNGKKVVVVLNNSSPVVMRNWVDNVDAVLEMYYPGQRGGIATANLLTGAVNPSGKLAFTIPRSDDDTVITHGDNFTTQYQQGSGLTKTTTYAEGINTGYKFLDVNHIKPEYDFGYGLSYTTFEYKDLKVKNKPAKGEDYGFDVTFKVKNTGKVKGSEVAEVYLGQAKVPNGIQSSPIALSGYVKVKNLKPGQTKKVKVHIGQRQLSYWNSNAKTLTKRADGTSDKWTVAKGPRTLYVGPASDKLVLKETINV